jgi:hypothetical protein
VIEGFVDSINDVNEIRQVLGNEIYIELDSSDLFTEKMWYDLFLLDNAEALNNFEYRSIKQLKERLLDRVRTKVNIAYRSFRYRLHIDIGLSVFRLFDIWCDKEISVQSFTNGIGLNGVKLQQLGNNYHADYISFQDNRMQADHQKLKEDLPFALTDSARQKCRERSHQFKTVQSPRRHQRTES